MPQSTTTTLQDTQGPVGSPVGTGGAKGGRTGRDSSADRPIGSRNTMFWRSDPKIDEARRHPGWKEFHRRCGLAGLYFDDIEASGREYSALAFRLQRSGEIYLRFRIAEGRGRGVIPAVLAAFRAAHDSGWAVDPALADLLGDTPAPPPSAVEFDDLLGDAPGAADEWELLA